MEKVLGKVGLILTKLALANLCKIANTRLQGTYQYKNFSQF